MKNKNYVLLNETNFNRIKKNISQNFSKEGLSISQSKVSEILSKSIGFSNYHHAQSEDFKTEKFDNNFQKDYPGIKGISDYFFKMKEETEKTFLFKNVKSIRLSEKSTAIDKLNVENLITHIKETENFVFTEILPAKELILNDLCNYLSIDTLYGIKFDVKLWIEYLNKYELLNSLYIGININTIFGETISYLKEKNEKLSLIFIERLCDYYKNTSSKNNDDFYFKLVNVNSIPLENMEIFSKIEDKEIKNMFIEKIIQNNLFNFENLKNKDQELFVYLIKTIRRFSPNNNKEAFNDIFDYKNVMDLKNKILSLRKEEDIKLYYSMLVTLFHNINIKLSGILYKELYFSIKENMTYLRNIEEVNTFLRIIENNLSKL